MGGNGRDYVIAMVAGMAAMLALATLFSVSLALAIGPDGFGGLGALDADSGWQLVTGSALVAMVSGGLAVLAGCLVRRPT